MRRTADDIYDEWLVLRCQSGEAAALTELVSRWHGRLVAHARRTTGDPDSACDIAQDAWLAIVRGLHRLDDPARFAPWAYRIVTFKCRDWTRRRARERKHTAGQNNSTGVTEPAAALDAPIDHSADELRASMRRLSPDHRAVLDLHYLDGLSVAGIAAALDIPAGTVKSRLHAARERLRAIIEPHTERIES